MNHIFWYAIFSCYNDTPGVAHKNQSLMITPTATGSATSKQLP
jgi:hypothetical protein